MNTTTNFRNQTICCLTLLWAVFACGSYAIADIKTWVGNTDVKWSTASNWLGGVAPVASDSLVFGVAGTSGTTLNNDYTAESRLTCTGITFTADAPSYVISPNWIYFSGDIVNNSNSAQTLNLGHELHADSTINAAAGDINFLQNNTINTNNINNVGYSLTITGDYDTNIALKVTNKGRITKTGTGTLTLSGNNVYSGGTIITGGRIIATNASALGTGAVTNNSELEFNLASNGDCKNAIIGSGDLYKIGTGTLNIITNGWDNYTGSVTVSEGVMQFSVNDTFGIGSTMPSVIINVNGGTLASNSKFTNLMDVNLAGGTINSNGGANGNYGAFLIKGAITVSGDKPSYINQTEGKDFNGLHIFDNTINVSDVADGDDLIVSATLRNAPGVTANGFTKTGAGTMRLEAANTYTGATTITEGRIIATNVSAFGSGAVTNNSELEFNLTTDGSGTSSNVISGTGQLIKTGAGTLTLSGTNEYTGGMTISSGTLDLSNVSGAGNGGTITLGDANTQAQNVQLHFSGDANSQYLYNIEVSSEGTGTVTLSCHHKNTLGSSTNTLTLNRDTIIELSKGVSIDSWFQIYSPITGTGNLTIKGGDSPATGGNNRMLLRGDNTGYSGNITLQSGRWDANTKETGTGTLYIGNALSDTPTIRLNLGTSISNDIVISAETPATSIPVIGNTNTNSTRTVELSGDIAFNHAATIVGNNSTFKFSGVWSGVGDITIDGNNVTHDTFANTWTGGMVINSGATFQPGHAQTLRATNAVEVNGTLQLNGVNQTIGALSGAGTIKNITGSNTLTVNQADNSTFSGTLINGEGVLNFIKSGAGTLTLSGTNTYTGTTTVSSGALNLDVADAIKSSCSVINNAAITFTENQTLRNLSSDTMAGTRSVSGTGVLTLDNNNNIETQFDGTITATTISFTGSGKIKINGTVNGSIVSSGAPEINLLGTLESGNLTISSGSTFSPGNSIGDFTLKNGNYTLESGATHLVELGDDPLDWDQLFVTGTVTLDAGSFLKIALDGVTLDELQTYELISSTDTLTNAATLSGLTGWELAVLASEVEGYTNGLFLQKAAEAPVPEPSTWALLILSALGMMYFRRKK